MTRFLIFFILILTSLSSCISKDIQEKEEEINLTDLDSVSLDQVEDDSEVLIADDEDFVIETEDDNISSLSSESSKDTNISNFSSSDSTEISNKKKESKLYEVQENDTLMLISWKLFGDYKKWKQLKTMNSDILEGGTKVRKGQYLFYYPPEVEYDYNPVGSPFLIRKGDTLGKISHRVYEDKKHWQAIWYNNRDLIRDPDLIFAGFTLYYKDFQDINPRKISSKIRLFQKRK